MWQQYQYERNKQYKIWFQLYCFPSLNLLLFIEYISWEALLKIKSKLSSFCHPSLQYISKSTQVVMHDCEHSFVTAGRPHCHGRECVSGVSSPARSRSGHVGVRWAIDPSQHAHAPGVSSHGPSPTPLTLCHGGPLSWHDHWHDIQWPSDGVVSHLSRAGRCDGAESEHRPKQ